MEQTLVSREFLTRQICYLCEKYIKGNVNVFNITAAGIDTIKISAEKWITHKVTLHKTFHLV